jgi:hypothetical protein
MTAPTTRFPGARVHEILRRIAVEQLPPGASLETQIATMAKILTDPAQYREFWRRVREDARPCIVCLCGSTRFWVEYHEANMRETMAGRIVLTVGSFVHGPATTGAASGIHQHVTSEQKAMLDQLHLRKIDLADEVLILNVDGYIGESTKAEIQYAQAQRKVIRYLKPPEEEGHLSGVWTTK